jgi:hypothetical protein
MTQVSDLSKPVASVRLRWGFALLLMEPALLFGVFVTASGGAVFDGTSASVVIIGILALVFRLGAGLALIGGVVLLWLGSTRAATGSGLTRVAVTLGGAGVLLFTPALVLFFGATSYAPLALVAILAATAGGVLVIIALLVGGVAFASARLRGASPSPQRLESVDARARRGAGIGVAAAVAIVVVLGLLVSLVWNPSAAAGGAPLRDIFAALGRDAAWSVGSIVLWAVLWIAAGLALLGFTTSRSPAVVLDRVATPRRVVTAGLWIIGAAMATQWFSYVALGMSLADDLPNVSGGGSSVVGVLYSVVGVVVLCVAVVRSLAPRGPVMRAPALIRSRRTV